MTSTPLVCVADLERAAADRLPPHIWDFLAGGAGDESVQALNRSALDRLRLTPRVLSGGTATTAGRLLGHETAMPVAVAPMAFQRLIHPDGEVATARAAAGAGVPFVLPMLSSRTLEAVAAVGGDLWLQLYWLRDRGLLLDVVRRAELVGCSALVVTVDAPVMGRRRRDIRSAFALPPTVTAALLDGAHGRELHRATANGSALVAHTAANFDPSADWSDVAWLRDSTALPILLKGLLDPRDVALAVRYGVDGIIVSNHGGRQLAGAIASITALPPIVAEADGRCPVLFDSGVRDGADVLCALACGADGVLYGRPVLWGLATGGGTGVRTVLDLLRDELREALTLAGCPSPAAARGLAWASV
ncbi:alpha-hydroxy acid oxidase [Streptomyces fuscichromogenes]|uniref:alpha-hydroxy acid oxidase n=1 Tax=Streptomyces fuscichromogenes TaxID=1324013 RepID=UPI001E32E212|nr:alpha-hydroxy acid oxidase [Streptomyces fuscichromogenes]